MSFGETESSMSLPFGSDRWNLDHFS